MAPLASQMSSPVAATRTAATPPSSKPTTTPAQVPLARPRSQSLELASSTSLPERDESPPRLAVEPPSPPRPMPLPLQQGDADSHTSQPSSAPSSTFSINVPPPPVPVPRLLLHSIVVPSVNVDPHEEFLINPAEFRVQSVSRITAPAGRVVYEVVFQDGHSAEIPVADIYDYVSEDEIERLENKYFEDNRNPETIYDFDPQYPGGEPSGGTYASEGGYLSGRRRRRVSRQRLVPTEKPERVKTRPTAQPTARRGRGGRPRGSSGSGSRRPANRNNSRRGLLAASHVEVDDEGDNSSAMDDGPVENALGANLVQDLQTIPDSDDEATESEDDHLAPPAITTHNNVTDDDMTESDDLTQLKSAKQGISITLSLKRKSPPSPDTSFQPPQQSKPFSGSKSASTSNGKSKPMVQLPITSIFRKKVLPHAPVNRKPNMERFLNAAKAHSQSMEVSAASAPRAAAFINSVLASRQENTSNDLNSITAANQSPKSKSETTPSHNTHKTPSRPSTATSSKSKDSTSKDRAPSLAEILDSIKAGKRLKQGPSSEGETASLQEMNTTPTPTRPTPKVLGFTPINSAMFYSKNPTILKSPDPGPTATSTTVKKSNSVQQPKLKNIRTAPTKPPPKPKSIRTPPVPQAQSKSKSSSRSATPRVDLTTSLKSKLSGPPKAASTTSSASTSSSSSRSSRRKPKKSSVTDEDMPDAASPLLLSSDDQAETDTNNSLSIMDDKRNYLADEEYIVEQILTFKREGGQKLYLVKWEGYPVADATWEPVENLEGSLGLVEEFERTRLRGG